MIKNERQYRITRDAGERIRADASESQRETVARPKACILS